MVRPAATVAARRRPVAAGFETIAVGTDLGGRSHAASYNGTSGFGRAGKCASLSGCFRRGFTLVPHVVGPLAANQTEAALMLSVMAGPDDRDQYSLPRQALEFRGAASGKSSLDGRE